MEEIQTLLRDTPEQKVEVANTIITNYDLPFNTDDVIKAFGCLRCEQVQYERAMRLMYLSLTTNLRMFIAIVYALIDDKLSMRWYNDLVTLAISNEHYILGCCWSSEINVINISKIWLALYDYYEFDISELTFSNKMRERIQKHIDSKARYTKPAIKQ